MTKTLEAYFEMMSTVRHVLTNNSSIWTPVAPFSAPCQHFLGTVLPEMIAAFGDSMDNSTGITVNKKELRAALEISIEVMASQIGVYAVAVGDEPLRTAVYTPKRALRHSSDDGIVGKAARIAGIATAHISVLAPYGVTPAGVAALNAESAAFSAAIGTPRAAIIAKKKVGEHLEDLRRQGMADLAVMDAIMPMWKISEPDFYTRYLSARRIIRRGKRHRALTLKVRNEEGAPVAGAILKIDAARILRKTSPGGQVHLQHLRAGAYDGTLTATGYGQEALKLHISADRGTVLEVTLRNKN